MSRKLFGIIIEGVPYHDPFFQYKPDATSQLGFSSYLKCSAAIRRIAYRVDGDFVDGKMRMSESTCIDSMYKFCQAIIEVFNTVYLREPNMEDTQQLLSINKKRGFSGLHGSTQNMLRVAHSYLRLLPAKISEFGMLFSAW
jgi:hypothetical protein